MRYPQYLIYSKNLLWVLLLSSAVVYGDEKISNDKALAPPEALEMLVEEAKVTQIQVESATASEPSSQEKNAELKNAVLQQIAQQLENVLPVDQKPNNITVQQLQENLLQKENIPPALTLQDLQKQISTVVMEAQEKQVRLPLDELSDAITQAIHNRNVQAVTNKDKEQEPVPACKHQGYIFSLAKTGDIPALQRCVDNGENINAIRTKTEGTLLHVAAEYGNINLGRWLVEHKIPLDAVDTMGRTALFVAVAKKHVGMTRLLVAYGANKDLRDRFGAKASSRAVTSELRRILE